MFNCIINNLRLLIIICRILKTLQKHYQTIYNWIEYKTIIIIIVKKINYYNNNCPLKTVNRGLLIVGSFLMRIPRLPGRKGERRTISSNPIVLDLHCVRFDLIAFHLIVAHASTILLVFAVQCDIPNGRPGTTSPLFVAVGLRLG